VKKWITDIEGVYGAGLHCGIKPSAKDLALIYVPEAKASAGVFTRNKFAAASVIHSKKCLKKGVLKAIVVNSGNANAGTGQQGIDDNKNMAKVVAKHLGLNVYEVGVASTGVIGKKLPIQTILKGLETLAKNPLVQQGEAIAQAILTTDTGIKTVFLENDIANKTAQIAGVSKGSGMIAPNMATTLSFLVTNINIKKQHLQRLLVDAVENSFNLITVDSDTSTNDMVLLVSTGKGPECHSDEDWDTAKKMIFDACFSLSQQVIRDGEGATKIIEYEVLGAVSRKDAKKIAKQMANSPLVKTAMNGSDPNWGRLLAAACSHEDVKINVEKCELFIGKVCVFSNYEPQPFNRERLHDYLKAKDVKVTLNLHLGKAHVKTWGCDLSEEYVRVNTEYS